MSDTEVVLVGAGPIGLEMAVALRDAGISYEHFEAQQVGHTISWFPRQARFFSSPERIAICGVPLMTVDQSKATREEYLAYLAGIVQQFKLSIHTYEPVARIESLATSEAQPDQAAFRFRVVTRRRGVEREFRCRHVITTIGDMHRPRPLAYPNLPVVPGADLPHVSSYFVEPHPYVGQRLLIVGGRNSAVEAAIRCHRAGAKVSLSYRRAELDSSIKYWLRPEIDWLIRTGDIEFYPSTVPVEIGIDDVSLAPVSAKLEPLLDRQQWTSIPSDFVLSLIGYEMDGTLLAGAGVKLRQPNGAPQIETSTMETNVPGLFVAGTAAGGTQLRFKLFIENCHAHVVKILRRIADQDPRHISSLAYTRLHEDPLAAES